MAKGVNLAPDSIKDLNACYVGAGGVKTVNAIYVGIDGVPIQVWPAYKSEDILTTQGSSFTAYCACGKNKVSSKQTSENLTDSSKVTSQFTWNGTKYRASVYGKHSTYTEGDGSKDITMTSYHYLFAVFDLKNYLDYPYVYIKVNGETDTGTGSINECGVSIQSSIEATPYFQTYYTAVQRNTNCVVNISKRVSSSRRYLGVCTRMTLSGSRNMRDTMYEDIYTLELYDENGYPDVNYTYTL